MTLTDESIKNSVTLNHYFPEQTRVRQRYVTEYAGPPKFNTLSDAQASLIHEDHDPMVAAIHAADVPGPASSVKSEN